MPAQWTTKRKCGVYLGNRILLHPKRKWKLTYKYWSTVKHHTKWQKAPGQIVWSHLYEASGIGRLVETESRPGSRRRRGRREWRVSSLDTGLYSGRIKNVLELDVLSAAQCCVCTKRLCSVLRWLVFTWLPPQVKKRK